MSAGQVINVEDLPPELQEDKAEQTANGDWLEVLRRWVERQLAQGDTGILEQATPQFERVMIETALKKSGGRRQDAARLLGWGRNTLTRKIKELGMEAQV
jgi:two-component system nitrogen regulation response regulator GlnG